MIGWLRMQGILHLFVIRCGRCGRVRHDFAIAGGFKMGQPSFLQTCSCHAFLALEVVVAFAFAIVLFGVVGEAATIGIAIAIAIAFPAALAARVGFVLK